MTKLAIDHQLVERLVLQVAPLVQDVTGWELGRVNSRAVPKERAFEELILGRLRSFGIPAHDDAPRDIFDRLLEYFVEGNALAAYLPWNEELVVIRENVDDSNLDGLKLVIGHELAHRAQHFRHPDLFAQVDEVAHLIATAYFEDALQPNLEQLATTVLKIQPVMTLLESHAMYVQNILASRYFPAARIESHFSLPVLLFRLFGELKTSQYTAGASAVAAAMASGDIDNLYQEPGRVFEPGDGHGGGPGGGHGGGSEGG